jgi:hypothetical protein
LGHQRKGRAIDELRQERALLCKTEALFEANSTLDYQAMIQQHPLMGVNNAAIAAHCRTHEQRHQSQIGDILRLPSFPRVA